MKVIKRNGKIVFYDGTKINMAIQKANAEVSPKDRITEKKIIEIERYVAQLPREQIHVEEIQDLIEHHLVQEQKYELAKKYIIYRTARGTF